METIFRTRKATSCMWWQNSWIKNKIRTNRGHQKTVSYFTASIFYRKGASKHCRKQLLDTLYKASLSSPASLFILPFLLSDTYFDHPTVMICPLWEGKRKQNRQRLRQKTYNHDCSFDDRLTRTLE